jgi:ankyrin repeat protein
MAEQDDDRDIDYATVKVADLQEGHLFRLIYSIFHIFTPVDWQAVLGRLHSPLGRVEARQWIETDYSERRLFLHELCDYNFGKEEGEHHPQSTLTELTVLKQAIEVYPEAVRVPDAGGYYPLHIVCRRERHLMDGHISTLSWRRATPDAFKVVLYAYPEAASLVVSSDGRTALNCLAGVQAWRNQESKERAVQTLLEIYPQALQIPDIYGRYPLHTVCDSGSFKLLLKGYPRAAEILCPSLLCSATPLLAELRLGNHDNVRLLLKTCPWTVGIEDSGGLLIDYQSQLEAVGDALDYACVSYCNGVGVLWLHDTTICDQHIEDMCDYRGYIDANVNFLGGSKYSLDNARFLEAAFDILLTIFRVMYGTHVQFLPLHAAVQGRLCRPWNLVVLNELLTRFGEQVFKKDDKENLPVHLFLESCMIERDRAIERGYAKDAEDYEVAVKRCLCLLLEANPQAASQTNGEGRLPLHLAIENRSLSHDTAVAPLLHLAPQALLARDMKTRLYPFANTAVGSTANLDLTFSLLQRDPTVMLRLDVMDN